MVLQTTGGLYYNNMPKNIVCWNGKELNLRLCNHELRNVPYVKEDEDGVYAEGKQHYFVKDWVKSVSYYHSRWSTMYIYFNNDTKAVECLGDNVNVDDKTAYRISNNEFISPEIKYYADGWIEVTPELVNWIKKQYYIDPLDRFSDIEKYFTVYETLTYHGVCTPIPSSYRLGNFGYSSDPLKMTEKEIETALNSIDDTLIREKVKLVLYARVFDKK